LGFLFWEQVELMGRWGSDGEEHDVRIVHAKVYGVAASEVALEGTTLVPKAREFVAAPPLLDRSPRLDSSDSELNDAYDDTYGEEGSMDGGYGEADEWEEYCDDYDEAYYDEI